jgi:MFS family permease
MAGFSSSTVDEVSPPPPAKVSHFKLVLSQTLMTENVTTFRYPGSGTSEDPYRVDWLPSDPRNPMRTSQGIKWLLTVIMAFGTLSVAFSSTAFSGALLQIRKDLNCSSEKAILSISLFVLGFAIAPMTWAPLSELYGRQVIYAICFTMTTIFGAASIASPNIETLLVLRFFAGVFGSSSIVNSAGVIADIFPAKERGLAMMVYTSAPFLGPTIGPIVGGFVGQYAGWRWVDAMTVIFTGVLWILGMLLVPETYTPYLLNRRAEKLSTMTGKVYRSKLVVGKPRTTTESLRTAIGRPWLILFFEPIVLILSIYSAIGTSPSSSFIHSLISSTKLTRQNSTVYGTLYLIFTAFPIVFESSRHWSQGISGLSYIGVMIGQLLSMFFYIFLEVRYQRKIAKNPSKAVPEGRLDPALIGSVLLPIGLFWFAWSTFPSVHWIVSIIGGSVFGFGQVLLFISLINYVVDAYTVYAASALAANAILRGLFGAIL